MPDANLLETNPDTNRPCRSCGQPYPEEVLICPRCRVPRKGDVNWSAIKAYGFFLFLMLLAGSLAMTWIMRK